MEQKENLSEWAKVNSQGKELGGHGSKPLVELGLCSRCAMMEYKKTRYGSCSYRCLAGERPIDLHPEDPIEDCSNFYPKGQMTLAQMFAIASPIEGGRRRQAGFITQEEMEANPDFQWEVD